MSPFSGDEDFGFGGFTRRPIETFEPTPRPKPIEEHVPRPKRRPNPFDFDFDQAAFGRPAYGQQNEVILEEPEPPIRARPNQVQKRPFAISRPQINFGDDSSEPVRRGFRQQVPIFEGPNRRPFKRKRPFAALNDDSLTLQSPPRPALFSENSRLFSQQESENGPYSPQKPRFTPERYVLLLNSLRKRKLQLNSELPDKFHKNSQILDKNVF